MTVSKILNMTRGAVIQARVGDTVAQVIALLAEKRIGCVPVVEGGRVVGIFSERDVVYGLARNGSALLDKAVGDVMTSPAVTIAPIRALSRRSR